MNWYIYIDDDDDDDDDRSDVYYNLMVWSTFTTIHMNVLCVDEHIMTCKW